MFKLLFVELDGNTELKKKSAVFEEIPNMSFICMKIIYYDQDRAHRKDSLTLFLKTFIMLTFEHMNRL